MFSEVLRVLGFLAAFWPWNAPETLEIHRNLTYKVVEGQELQLDLLLPAEAAAPRPVVLIIHGGSWIWGNKNSYPALKRYLVQEGFACAAVEYGQWLDRGFYGQVQDVKDAIRWLRANAATYALDPEMIGLFGSSSGGHLAALAAFCGDSEGFGADPPGLSSKAQAVFLLYGVYDLDGLLTNALVERLAGGFAPEDVPELYQFFSPLDHIDGTEPPTYVMHGTADRVVPFSQAEELVETLRAAGVPVIFTRIWDGPHAFARVAPSTRPITFDTIVYFFESQLK
ncbi:MAG: alpha/beta hydrolase [Candidatus Hydrogenedentes bacterium]|nr:alpha/beta hydrolase [Candidatus Hydrogenedentota bacterium]